MTVISNDGTYTEAAIQASYWTDGTIYAPSFVPSGYYTGVPYLYNAVGLPGLAPASSQSYLMDYFVPASVPLGTILVFKDTVSYSSPLSTWITDPTPWNNVCYFNPWVVGPYDPNFKEVQPQGLGPNGLITYSDSVLTYMVHFQNTGSYPAENVVVKDTLDPSLDWTTLAPVYLSANGKVEMDENGHVTFTFNDIDLPPASAEPITSNGFFVYKIKLRPALPVGTQIKNSASIYFDFNAPVKTNSTLNQICSFPAYVSNTANEQYHNTFSIYPNPADNTCTVELNNSTDGAGRIQIADINGKTIASEDIALKKGAQNVPVNISHLISGVYFVTIMRNGAPETQKLVILK